MDKSKTEPMAKRDWSWLPAAMPTVASLIADQRKTHGAAWVSECWRRGVSQGEPGHFFAAEGALMVGTPASAEMLVKWFELRQKLPGSSIVHMPAPPTGQQGGGHGAG